MKKADIPELRSLRPEPNRDWRSKGHLKGGYVLPNPQDGRTTTFTRATTLAGLHEDHETIVDWKLRGVLEGVTYDPEILPQVAELVKTIDTATDWRESKPAKDKLTKLAKGAHDLAGGNDGSKWGTLLHTITEWEDAGRLDEVLPEIESWGETGEMLLADLAAYREAMANAGLKCSPEYVERIVVNTTVRTGGTFDRLVRIPDGRLWIGDVKTQKSMAFGAVLHIAAQLAEYAYADAMLTQDGRELEKLPAELDQEHALIMWIPVGSAKCQLIELGPQEMQYGWDLAQHAAQTLWFRELADQVRGRPYDPASITTPEGVLSELRHAESREHLEAIWKRPASKRVWTSEHSAVAKARSDELAVLR